MPAEWHPHTATWMSWASLQETYTDAPQDPETAFGMAKQAYSLVAKAVARFEPVNMITNRADIEEVKKLCGPAINVIEAEIDDGWFRDSGPSFLINRKGDIAGVNWVFNGYGNKFTLENDAKIAKTILNREGIKCFDCPLVTEGGAIHVDGEGTLLATENSIINKNRNPDLTKTEIENHLIDYLNLKKIIWLNGDVTDDETDGHVDGLACFIRPGTVMASVTPNENHPDYDVLQENLEILKSSTDAKGRPLEVVEVNNPSQFTEEGMIYTGLYLNHYIANGAVILPLSGFAEDDREALILFKKEYPNHEVVQVPSKVVWFGGGNVHCITQQQPSVNVSTQNTR
jgi:agmatine deiminase